MSQLRVMSSLDMIKESSGKKCCLQLQLIEILAKCKQNLPEEAIVSMSAAQVPVIILSGNKV